MDVSVLRTDAAGCARCPQLAEHRTQVVFGTGRPDTGLMIVGEAPGRGEDEQGVPFAGRSAALLDELLRGAGVDAYLTTALKCRPPGNRDPLPQEAANCSGHLAAQLEAVRPRVVCALGNYVTKLLRGDPTPVTRLHGVAEVRTVGPRAVRLVPLYHPAAALYDDRLLAALRADFATLPALLALDAPPQPEPVAPPPPAAAPEPEEPDDIQLGLF